MQCLECHSYDTSFINSMAEPHWQCNDCGWFEGIDTINWKEMRDSIK